jgi:hypothetical protein
MTVCRLSDTSNRNNNWIRNNCHLFVGVKCLFRMCLATSPTRGLTASQTSYIVLFSFKNKCFVVFYGDEMPLRHTLYTILTQCAGKHHEKLMNRLSTCRLVAQLIASNSRITSMELCANVLGELNVVTLTRYTTTL